MNALFDMRDTVQQHSGSPLTVWLKRHGSRTVAKYNELLKAGGVGPIMFQAETPDERFEAYIDPDNQFAPVDKFSQVCCLYILKTSVTPTSFSLCSCIESIFRASSVCLIDNFSSLGPAENIKFVK